MATPVLVLLASTAQASDLPIGPGQTYPTIASAVAAATDGDRLVLGPGTHVASDVAIADLDLTITGDGAATIVGQDAGFLFIVNDATLWLGDVILDGGGGTRGVQATNSIVELMSVEAVGLASAATSYNGGALEATDSTVSIGACTFSDGPEGAADGGYVHLLRSPTTVRFSTFVDGRATRGGAIFAMASDLTVEQTLLSGQSTSDYGGAIFADGSALTIRGSTFANNSAGRGGAFSCRNTTLCEVGGSWLEANDAGDGGALHIANAEARILGTMFCKNTGANHPTELLNATGLVSGNIWFETASTHGTLDLIATTADVINNHFVRNDASSTGSAVMIESGGMGTLINNLFVQNTGPGSAVDANTAGLTTAAYNWFSDNLAFDATLPLDPTNTTGVDPQLAGIVAGDCNPANLAPSALSPLLGAGDPSLLNPDGSPSDIGAFGGEHPFPLDADGDGFPEELDCDDANPEVSPKETELACDGLDNDCDPATVDAPDGDGDGVSSCDDDCDDDDDATFPGALELCDGVDRDCDTLIDAADPDCDADRDGATIPSDCDDGDATVFPGATEERDDGVDQDCDGFDAVSQLGGVTGVACGCRATPGGAGLWLLLFVAARTRRRPATPS